MKLSVQIPFAPRHIPQIEVPRLLQQGPNSQILQIVVLIGLHEDHPKSHPVEVRRLQHAQFGALDVQAEKVEERMFRHVLPKKIVQRIAFDLLHILQCGIVPPPFPKGGRGEFVYPAHGTRVLLPQLDRGRIVEVVQRPGRVAHARVYVRDLVRAVGYHLIKVGGYDFDQHAPPSKFPVEDAGVAEEDAVEATHLDVGSVADTAEPLH
mmetsp:Transcript_38573/g.92913  ORF Transcript_38573/g.92913 Transcript_38573/m.92913 type:complete len:208 (-) Transcript_38573:400-1023(-)